MRTILCSALAALSVIKGFAADDWPPFHTQDEDFRGVEPPAWLLDGAAKIFLGLEDLSGIDEAAAAGVTILHAGGPAMYYPLRRDDPSAGIPEPEKSRIIAGIARARKHGMRVILGISPYAPVQMVKDHPGWIVHPADDPAIRERTSQDLTTDANIGLRALPLNTPWGDHAVECLAEIMRDYGADGFSFDGCYHPVMNFSPWERDLYRKETGRALPKGIDLASMDYRTYLLWADEKLEQWYRRLGTRLQQINPEAAVCTWTANAGRYGHFLTSPRVMSARMNRLIHSPVQEWWLDEVNLGSSVVPMFGAAYVRAVSGGKVGMSEPYLMSRGNPYSADSFPPHELTVRCLGAMTNGSFTPLAMMAGKDATYATMREIVKRRPWFVRLEPEPWAALLVSEQTRQFYAWGHIMERFLSHALGVFRVAFEEHLPLALLTEQDLRPEILAKFRVLVLANAVCLSDRQAETIRTYVKAGGGLVATCESSLCDAMGRPRPDFALKDLFGVSFQGRPQAPGVRPQLDANFSVVVNDSYWAQRSNIGAFRWGGGDIADSALIDDARLRHLVPNCQAAWKGPMVRTGSPGLPMKNALIFFPEASREAYSCASIGEQGQGRVVYFSNGIDAANYSYAFPYQRILLARAMRWAARTPPPFEVRAPMCVQSTFWRQSGPDGPRTVIHLWNGLNSSAGHGAQEVEVPLREEAVPVHGIEIRFTGSRPASVRCEPDGTLLEPRADAGSWIISVPPVPVHTAIVISPAPGPQPAR